ncbi:uncharacterized protein [Venturia canescens]|uniref:uncharacterized protein n=1 Tax=Venturia canescens TaxID=32260 RepID=UPI001C9C457B|nr:uncharacterized protein LOC122406127 [Venturia canescens]
MRSLAVVALCFSMVILTAANDLTAGERQEGDVLVASRNLIRRAVPGKPMIAQTGFNTVGQITAVRAVNAPGSNAVVEIVKGGPGQSNVVVTAMSAPGEGIDVKVDIYATEPAGGSAEEPASS